MNFLKLRLIIIFTLSIIHLTAIANTDLNSNCGTLLTSLMSLDPEKNTAKLEDFAFSKEEYCDLGTREVNANFDVQIFDRNNKLINEKSVFLNLLQINETLKPNNPSEFGVHKFTKNPQYRTLKFAIKVPHEMLGNYKIISKKDNKVLGTGATYEKK